MTISAKYVGLGVKFGGACGVCGRDTGTRDFERAATALYKRADGRFVPVHPACAGGSTKSRIGGGIAWRQQPHDTIEVET